ncbi:putative lipoprotein [Clostridium sp. MSTE9]|uniref:hypothetical protein n=1 Tax=Clostridium sp. (strain MSTE9) TaxID=1105031 RepID=UPI00026F2993|nr:hypothetical protein [Clostridium sp. MSTE9]EJF41740.1 putative lipoprotein [Clostridium sp. MSTE9]
MVKQSKAVLAGALALTVFAAALAGCAGTTSNSEAKDSSGGAQTSSSSDGETVYAGKVTAITGNQVTLELGTVEGAGQGAMPSGERMKRDENASGTGSAPSGSRPERRSPNESGSASRMMPPAESGAASGSSQSASGEKRASREVSITLTGETKTVLVPVGLTLSGSGMGAGMPEGGGMPGGNGGNAGNGGGMPTQSGASQSRQSSSGTKQGSAAQSASRASSGKDYSSITVGMILQITEKTGSDGTQTITAVRVLSK